MSVDKQIRKGFPDLIYEIFIGRLGCLERDRAEFVNWLENGGQGGEFRLNSSIGPGTKFRFYNHSWYVDYYQEYPKTDGQIADIAHVNELLGVLYRCEH